MELLEKANKCKHVFITISGNLQHLLTALGIPKSSCYFWLFAFIFFYKQFTRKFYALWSIRHIQHTRSVRETLQSTHEIVVAYAKIPSVAYAKYE